MQTYATADNPNEASAYRSRRYMICCFFCLTFVFLWGWILNDSVFKYYDFVFSWVREISTAVNGITLIAIALVASRKTLVLNEKAFSVGAATCIACGLAGTWIGIMISSPLVLVVCASLSAVGRGIISILIGLSCVHLAPKNAGICVAGAYLFSYLLRNVLVVAPPEASATLFIVTPFVALLLISPYMTPVISQIRKAEPPAKIAITQPSSFLPFGHHLFMYLLLFRIAYGYALTLGEIDGVPIPTTFVIIPLATVLAIFLGRKKPPNPDALFQVSFLLVIAGFLLLAIPLVDKGAAVNSLLMSGAACFEILVWITLIALSSQNKLSALPTFSWGLAMNSIGVIIGANLGRITNALYKPDAAMVSCIAALAVFLFIVYFVVSLRKFSFSDTIAGIEPEREPVTHIEPALLELRCEEIGKRYGLTAREIEVFDLLARGRNGRYIKDELVVSYNTVKAHVRHIYAKLGIHSQQELIDLAEHYQENGQEIKSVSMN